MADLNKLLDTPADDLKQILVPVGTWKGTLKSVKLKDAKTDKNDREYIPALLAVSPHTPLDDVDRTELAELNGSGADIADEALFYRMNLYGRSDFAKLKNILESLGVPGGARSVAEMVKEAKNLPCVIEVDHEKYEGEDRNVVKAVYADEQ